MKETEIMKKLTIILAHGNYSKSIANKTIINRLIEKYPDATLKNISELYPDFNIDIESEQKSLVEADVVLLQFPVYWYNMPAILKQWMDKVLSYGFAYGENGDKVKDKTLIASITAGGRMESYTPIGSMHFYLRQFFNNIESTAYYCQMKFAEPVLGYGNIYIPNVANTPEIVSERANEQADRLIKVIDDLLK